MWVVVTIREHGCRFELAWARRGWVGLVHGRCTSYVGGELPVMGWVFVCVVRVFLGWAVLVVRGRCVVVHGWGQWWWWVRRIWTSCVGDHTSCVRVDGWGVVVRQGAAAGRGQ